MRVHPVISVGLIGGLALSALFTASAAQAFRGRGAAFAIGAAAGSANSAPAYYAPPPAQVTYVTAPPAPAPAPAPPAPAPAAPAAPTVTGAPLPMGTVVASLPSGCASTPVGNVNYYYCGGNFYQAVFEGSTLKYITTKPK